jgi:predicted acylesterase/phospholipase RssA
MTLEGSAMITAFSPKRPGAALALFPPLLLLALAGCSFMRTPFIAEQLNRTTPPSQSVPATPLPERMGLLVRGRVADAYLDRDRVAGYMAAVGAAPDALIASVRCLEQAAGSDPGGCYTRFVRRASGLPPIPGGTASTPLWGLPAPLSGSLPGLTTPAAAAEIDAQRFLGNLLDAGAALAALETLVGRGPFTDADIASGIQNGMKLAADYVKARKWGRDMARRSNALVVSGGAANGAFGAGVVWRLLEVLEACRGAANGGCGDARIDLAVGTSTGALIGLVVDSFFVQGRESAARDLLLQSYTCSVESDLYCVNDTWDWNLVRNVRGLVRFDGVRSRIESQVAPETWSNGTELVAVSVDFESGNIFAESDQDPADRGPPARRVEAVLASIVEPVLADPVDGFTTEAGKRPGTFLDGGVRSGLPLLEAVRRGAERVLVIANSGVDPEPRPRPKHAFEILMRTVDLLSTQPKVGELGEAELSAVVRRLGEYNVCLQRLGPPPVTSAVTAFCERRPPAVPIVAAVPWGGPPYAPQVATSWRTAWFFRPEEQLATAQGYAFKPEVMRPLFLTGVRTFQRRCKEILGLYEVRGSIADAACAEPQDQVVTRAESRFRAIGECTTGKPAMRSCD